MKTYEPINCSWYDQLEALALSRKPVEIIYNNQSEETVTLTASITDVFTKEAAEWLKTADGLMIRLDTIRSVNGQPLSGECRL